MNEFDLEVFYDGQCPLCLREMTMLKKRDTRGRIRFTDIADPGFNARTVGIPWDTLISRIHARLPDGTMVEGVEVFRRLYSAVGFPRLAAASRLPGIAQALDLGYRWFAKNRLRLTGRCAGQSCTIPAASIKR